MVTVVDL
jgi:hypothetical protein